MTFTSFLIIGVVVLVAVGYVKKDFVLAKLTAAKAWVVSKL
jgi:hypothetical protein